MQPDLCQPTKWYAMRDLCRANAHVRAYDRLVDSGFEVFTPLRWSVSSRQGKKVRRKVPVIADLLFVHSSREELDPEVNKSSTLQYRFMKGGQAVPMTVPDSEMQRFMLAVASTDDARYFTPDEILPSMIGRRVRLVGGPLDGYIGNLLHIRGSRKKRLLVGIPGFLTVAVEVNPEFIEIAD